MEKFNPILRVALSLCGLAMVPGAVAGCPSAAPATATAIEVNPCAAAPRGMAFTHATFRVPTLLRDLEGQGCLAPIPGNPGGGGGALAAATTALDRIAGTTTAPSASDLPPAGQVPGPPPLDWNYTTPAPAAPVTSTPALYIAHFPSSDDTNDRLFYGTSTTRGPNFYALNGLYNAAPSVLWSRTNGGMDGSAVVLSEGGTMVYALDSRGSMNCYDAATGGNCAGWSAQAYATGNGAALSSPWIDYATRSLYFGDLAGYLYKLDAGTGTLIWKVDLNAFMSAPCASGCAGFAVRSSPIVADGMVYVGNDAGVLFRVRDPGATAPAAAQIDASWLCASPASPDGCGAAWSVVNGATLDTVSGFLYAAANGVVFEYPHGVSASWVRSNQVDLGTAAGYAVYSSPIVDYNNMFVYVGYYNRLHKIAYPFTASRVSSSAALAGKGADPSYPRSSPMPFSNAIFIGDGAGSSERFGCASSPTPPVRTAQTVSYGTSVDSVPVIDFGTGNINFGYSNGPTSGGVVQIERTASWGCAPGKSCPATACAEDAPAGGCIGASQCCTTADCGTVANGTATCDASNNCVSACAAGFTACGHECIPDGSCCTSADCAGATPVCSGVGGTCSGGQSITFSLRPAAGAGAKSVVATISTPVTSLTTGTATFTQGNVYVVGTGTGFTAAFKPGQQVSPDGSHFYTIASITNDTTIVLTAPLPLPTQTVATYYQADCIAGQTCPTSATYVVACTSIPCALTVQLPRGDYALSALAYGGAGGSGRVVGALNETSKFRLTGGADDLATVSVVLPRIYPVGVTGNDARCPLDLTVDSSGNVWTANGNGDSGSNCSGPTDNVSKLVKASGYAATVINNAAISASPEDIEADGAGNVWLTVPSLGNGIFRLDASGAVAAGFPVGNGECAIPRGVAVDQSATGGSAYVTCYGSLAPGSGSGRKVTKWAPTGGATPAAQFDLSDATDQPVSVIVPYASSRTDNRDYNCQQNVYVNRSSTTRMVISRLPLDLTAIATYTQDTADQDPYGLTFDGYGTAYAVARRSGDVVNVEYDGTAVVLVSDNAKRAAPSPWGIAADDQYVVNVGGCGTAAALSDLWVTHGGNRTVSRFSNLPQYLKNNYLVGASANPQPRAIVFDPGTDGALSGFLWVVNSADGSLSRIHKKLALQVTADSANVHPTACPPGAPPGGTITLTGKGFDPTPAMNTVIVGGYLGTVTAVTINASPALDTMTVEIASDVAGVIAPITVVNDSGAVQTINTYTTL